MEEVDAEQAASCKRAGDVAFVKKQFEEAELAYTESLKHDPKNHLVWANRSAARFRLGRAEGALADAQTSRELNPKYLKVRSLGLCSSSTSYKPELCSYNGAETRENLV